MPVIRARLVGRTNEVETLRQALKAVRAGAGRTVVVAGEAGIGKTRLVDELTSDADGFLVLSGQCADSGSGPVPHAAPGGLLAGIVATHGPEATVEAAGPAAGALSAVAPQLVVPGTDAGADRLPEVLADLLARTAAGRPVVAVVEDLHWSDDVTRALVVRLARAAPPGLLLLLTYRSDDVGRAHPLRTVVTELDRARLATRIDLRRLGQDEVREMARDLLTGTGDEPDDDLADLAERSEGVPFYVEELVGFLGTDLPDSLRDILLLRYWSLGREAQALCRVVSAAGSRVWHDVLDDVLADQRPAGSGSGAHPGVGPQPEERAREAIDAHVLVATDVGYAFRHALVQEAVYAELLPGERRRLHAAYARALERALTTRARSVAKLSRIADHWWRAGILDRALAAAVVAHEAATAAATSAAVSLGERALELWEQVPDAERVAGVTHHELLRAVAESLRGSTRVDRALAVAHEALAEWPDDDPVGQAAVLADIALIAGHAGSDEGPDAIDRALALVPPGLDDTVRAQVLILRARHAMLDGRRAESAAAATEAYDAATAVGSPELASVALNLRGVSRFQLGDRDGLAEIDRGREIAGDTWQGLSRYYINGSDARLTEGLWDEAADIAAEGVVAAREHGASEGSRAMLEGNIVEAMIGRGDWAEAARWYERKVPMIHTSVYAVYLGERRTWLAMWRGQVAWAQAEARRKAATWERFGRLELQIRSHVAVTRAELALLRDDPAEALRLASDAVDPDAPRSPTYDLEPLAVAARAIADLRAAGQEVDDAPYRAALAECSGWRTYPAWAAVFEAELGTGAWTAVLDLPGPAYLVPYALQRDGERLLDAGDRAGARSALAAAVGAARKIGAGLLVDQAQGLLERAGLAGRPADSGGAGRTGPAATPPSDDGLAALTAREQQVLALVAEGLTNGQIAERLFISAKTASVHVSAILRKLNVSTRTEAALLAAR
ncbi:AAA family ATPase [Promicromonospora sp. NPDC023987]|uniref:ATP-binding protein n=1 Tax=Promicromonospora sp. NPDC023987 TaxID=3155360 RepID=UPI0033EA398F